jgi:hypothetical protein
MNALNIQLITFTFGAMLLLIGILGGGFEIKELKIPQVGRVPRFLAASVGALFIILGVGMESGGSTLTPPVPSPSSAVDFMIYDALGEGQVSEQVTILIDGKSMGTLTVSQYHPSAAMTVTVPRPGKYSYTAEATAVYNIDGELYQYTGTGQGMIDVKSGKNFILVGSISGNTWLISLRDNT